MQDQISERRRRKQAANSKSVADSIAFMLPGARSASFAGEPRERPIRMTFRFGAGLLAAVGAAILLVSAYSAFNGQTPKAALGAVSVLPLAALMVRSGAYAAWLGRIAPQFMWPFASGKVALARVVLIEFVRRSV